MKLFDSKRGIEEATWKNVATIVVIGVFILFLIIAIFRVIGPIFSAK